MIDGGPSDAALHAEILNNPAAEEAIAQSAINRAVAGGMSPQLDEELYGVRPARTWHRMVVILVVRPSS